jgi:hypothetical protein
MGNRKKKDKKKALKHRFAKKEPPIDVPGEAPLVLFEPPGQAKMSDVLMTFIKPYEDTWENLDELRELLGVAIVAWNAAIEPDHWGEAVQSALAKLPPDDREECQSMIAELVERKQQFFAQNRRLIIDYELSPLPDGQPYLSVISTLPV